MLSKKFIDTDVNSEILAARKEIEINAIQIKKYKNDLEPHLSPDLLKALKLVSQQYCRLEKCEVDPDCVRNLRMSNAKAIISCGCIDDFVSILSQSCYGILELNGTEKVDENLFNIIITIINIFTESSDISSDFGDELCHRDGLLNLYRRILSNSEESCLKGILNDCFIEILEKIIGTLYNILMNDSGDNILKIQSLNFLDIIKKFLNCNYERLKIHSLLFMVYVVNESDSALFKSDGKSITYLLNLFFEAVQVKSGVAQGLSLLELARGIEKLSKNDANKQMLVDLGVLPIIKRLLKKNSLKYKEIGTSILWSLAFDEKNRKIISENFSSTLSEMKNATKVSEVNSIPLASAMDCSPNDTINAEKMGARMPRMIAPSKRMLQSFKEEEKDQNKTKKNSNIDVDTTNFSKNLNGLFWTLKESESITASVEPPTEPPPSENSSKDGHIMISYCWSNSEIVLNIYNTLKDFGYKLWIDKYNMAEMENLMESMASAVENAVALIVCVSSSYKESANCRAEAQYAVTKKKPIIPIMVQQKYRPDGWLGICITGLLYVDFKGSRTFEVQIKELCKNLERIFSLKKPEVEGIDKETKVNLENKVPKVTAVMEWSNGQVMEWFKNIGLSKISWKSHYDGQELSFLQILSNSSIETFFQLCIHELDLSDLRDFRIFYENIRTIQSR